MQYMFYSHTQFPLYMGMTTGNMEYSHSHPQLHHLRRDLGALPLNLYLLTEVQSAWDEFCLPNKSGRLNSNLFWLLQGVTECDGQELSSLPSPSSSSSQMNLVEATSTLLSSLTRLRSHFFFMRLDYQLAQGFPCLPTGSVAALTRKYKRWVR